MTPKQNRQEYSNMLWDLYLIWRQRKTNKLTAKINVLIKKQSEVEAQIILSLFLIKAERIRVFATISNFLILISFQPMA